MGWKTWNDRLSLVLILLIVALWVGSCWLPQPLPESVIGATIVVFTLVAQFYFRKKEDEPNNSG
jgi:putative effector of murein hydrolase LrgA (UPF0299 family)